MFRTLSFSLILFLLLNACPLEVFADQIFLKNGDRLTGKIVKKDGDKILIETEAAGKISILWSAVEKIVSEDPLNIELSDGISLRGTALAVKEKAEEKVKEAEKETAEAQEKPEESPDEKIRIETEDAEALEIEKKKIKFMRSQAEQARFEAEEARFLNPGLFELWRGTIDVGFSLTHGNADTKTFTAGLRTSRETRRDKTSVYANAIQASNSTSGRKLTTAQAVYGGARYDYNVSERFFIFGSGDFEYDKPQKLDFRAVLGSGFGYKLLRTRRTKLDIFGGATLNRANFSNDTTRTSAEGLIGNELNFRVTDGIILEQRLAVYPGLSEIGEFRFLLNASILTKLNSWLGWHVTVGDRFNSNPVPGAVSNDFLFTTGLRATFGNRK